jgi:hypothetical protein
MSWIVKTLRSSAAHTAADGVAGTVIGTVDDGGEIESLHEYREALFVLNVTAAATDVTDLLDVFVDISLDDGSTWINAVHFDQITGDSTPSDADPTKYVAMLEYHIFSINTVVTGETINVTDDAPAGTVRPIGIGTNIRYRGVVAEGAGAGPASFTYSLQVNFEVD